MKIQGMMRDIEVEQLLGCVLDLLNAWITELEHLSAIFADEVIVLREIVRWFEVRNILPELMLGNKLAVEQQIHRVVKRSAAYTIVLVFHLDVQRLNVEVILLIVDLVEYCESFGCFAVPVFLQVFGKDLLNLVFGFDHSGFANGQRR